MKAKDLRDLTTEELVQRHDDVRQEFFNLRIQRAIGQMEKPVRLREIRRDLARIKTVVRERERMAEKEHGDG